MSPSRIRIVVAALLSTLALPALAGAAAPGDSASGFTPLAQRFGASGNDTATGIALRHDGRVVVSVLNDGEYDRRIIGLRADGTLDPTFSEDGIWHRPQNNTTLVRAVATLPDGKVVFAGDDASQQAIVIGRLMKDGELDPTFGGGDGLAVYPGGAESNPWLDHISVQSDGKLLFAGSISTATKGRELLIGRLNANGTDDTSFAGSPFTTFGFIGAVNDRFAGIQRMPNGEFAVGVAHETGLTGVIRVLPAANGFAVKDLDMASSVELAVDVAAVDATHVVTMSSTVGGPMVFARVDVETTPKLDPSWGTGGTATPLPDTFVGEQLLRQAGGKLLVAGYDGGRRAIARLLPSGALDTSFATGGIRLLDGSSGNLPQLRTHELAIAADGSIFSASNVSEPSAAKNTAVEKLVGSVARLRAEIATPNASPTVGINTPMVLRVHNDGPDASGSTKVTFTTSAGLGVISSDGPCKYTSLTTGSCDLPDVASGATRDITLQVRATTAGAHSVGMNLTGTTLDDDANNDTATLITTFAAAPPQPGGTPAAGGTPAGGGAAGGGAKPGAAPQAKPKPTGPQAVVMTIRRLTARNGRVLRCGFTERVGCAAPQVKPRRRTVPMWVRISAKPTPGTAKRRISILIQRKEGRRWVKRGDGTLDLRANGELDLTVPTEMRHGAAKWRMQVFVKATSTTKAARSPWFYLTVR